MKSGRGREIDELRKREKEEKEKIERGNIE